MTHSILVQGADDIVSGVRNIGSHCVLALQHPPEHKVFMTVLAINGAGFSTTRSEVRRDFCLYF
jgi:hypothetical protein